MAHIHIQHHPFYYAPHAPSFLAHSRNEPPQSKPALPLPTSLPPPTPTPPPPPPPPPPSSSITIKMAHAPPFVPQLSSPLQEQKESARLPPLLPFAQAAAMAHSSFYLHSCAQPPPMPPLSSSLLHRMLEIQAVSDPIHQTYFLYQPTYPLAPVFSAVPSTCAAPPTAPLYYSPAGASPFGDDGTAKVNSLHQEDWEKRNDINIVTAGAARGWMSRAGKGAAGGFFFQSRHSRVQRRGTWTWVPKEEAERRRHLGDLEIRQTPTEPSSSASSSDSPSASTFFSASSSADFRPAPPTSLEFEECMAKQDTRTTIMIKNIPNKFRREMLVKLLDDHCVKVNNNRVEEPNSPYIPPSEYDFVYLPMDFSTNSCLGYAFVNFTTPAAAWRFYEAMNDHKWDMFGTKKITRICYARIQGKEAMLANFGASLFRCESDEYLPVTFSPPRNGAEPRPPSPTLVGKRWSRCSNTPRQPQQQQQEAAAASTAAVAPDIISTPSFSNAAARSSPKT